MGLLVEMHALQQDHGIPDHHRSELGKVRGKQRSQHPANSLCPEPWYLVEALNRTFDPEIAGRAEQLRNTIEQALGGDLTRLLSTDEQDLHSHVSPLLMEVSAEVRASYFAAGDDHLDTALKPGADLMGRNFRARRLCGADLGGTYLIAADLRDSGPAGQRTCGTAICPVGIRSVQICGIPGSKAPIYQARFT